MKYIVYTGEGSALVRGTIDGFDFDGDGKPFEFTSKKSQYICDLFPEVTRKEVKLNTVTS